MPASRSGARDVPDMEKLVGQEIRCKITKLDIDKDDVVVDRRVVLEQEEKERREAALSAIHEGQVIQGTVKTLMDFGAFIDIGGIDGLLHVTDMSWTRVNKPSDLLKPGEQVDVKVLKVNPENRKISLGMKQLQPDPWALAAEKFQGWRSRSWHGGAPDRLRRVRQSRPGRRWTGPHFGDVVVEEDPEAQRCGFGRRLPWK